MLKFALFGAGRIGRMHAANLAGHKKAELLWVYDINQAAGDEVAASFGARSSSTMEEPLSDPEVDAVLIATSTDTHAPLIVESAKAGKAVFCEKPIDLSLEKVDWCRDQIRNLDVPVQICFNRRFDPSHRKVALAAQNGEIGALEQVLISSRDPEPPPKEYYLVAGGMLRDMTIHDFDLARFVLNEEVVGEAMQYITENADVIVVFCEGEALTVQLPAAVVLEVIETEPNDSRDKATRVPLGSNLNGQFNKAGDVDHLSLIHI